MGVEGCVSWTVYMHLRSRKNIPDSFLDMDAELAEDWVLIMKGAADIVEGKEEVGLGNHRPPIKMTTGREAIQQTTSSHFDITT